MRAAVIINPISGAGGRPDIARQRLDLAAALVRTRADVDADVSLTERPGHAIELARAALARGVDLVVAWGGDGTVNEVASVLAFGPAALGVVPSGSGNGLARELGLPLHPPAAFGVAFDGADLVMDAGELDGRLFFNIAGIGIDARVAHRFTADGLVRRGFLRYMELTFRELLAFRPDEYAVAVDGDVRRSRALLIAIANARQYGNGATIAPRACIDDGLLDVVVVDDRPLWQIVRHFRSLFSGGVDRVPGVDTRRGRAIEITSAHPVLYHVDGEPFVGAASLRARVHPRALRIRVPGRRLV